MCQVQRKYIEIIGVTKVWISDIAYILIRDENGETQYNIGYYIAVVAAEYKITDYCKGQVSPG